MKACTLAKLLIRSRDDKLNKMDPICHNNSDLSNDDKSVKGDYDMLIELIKPNNEDKRNFCDYYKKPFPKHMIDKEDGTVIYMTGLHITFYTKEVPIFYVTGIGTVTKIGWFRDEIVGNNYKDWNLCYLSDMEE